MDRQEDDLLLRAATEAIFIIENKRVLTFNEVGREMLGYSNEELRGLPVSALFVAPMNLQIESCLINGTQLNIETQVLSKSGKSTFVQLQSKDLSEGSRRITSFSLHDISAFKQAEMALLAKDALLESLSYAAARFLESQNWDDEIDGVLHLIGSSAKVSRAYIFRNFTDDGGRLYTSQKYEWVAEGVEPQLSNTLLQRLYLDEGVDMMMEHLSKGQVIKSLVKDLPEAERKIMEEQGVQSVFLTPIFQHNQWWGFIGYDECNYERLWTSNETQLLKAVSDIFTAALERKAVEEKLKRSNENFSSMFNNSPDGIFVYDYNGNVLDVNVAGCLLNGISRENFLNTHVSELVPDGDRQKIAADFQKWVTGEYSIIESNSKSPDGTLVPVEIRGTNITYSDKPAILLLVRDISRRRESEKLLRKKMEFIQFISRISSDFIKIDLENIGSALNNALEFVCKYTGNERGHVFQLSPAGNSMILTSAYCHPDFKSNQDVFERFSIEHYHDFVQTLKNGEIVSVHSDELELNGDNHTIPYLPKFVQVKSSINIPLIVGGHLLGFIAFDCTRQKKTWDKETLNAFNLTAQIIANTIIRRKSEDELIEAKNKAEQSDRLKTAFLGQMSHEMRTPLNSIIGFAEILEKEIADPDLQDMVSFILSGGERLLNTFNLIIDLSEIESNIMKAHREELDLNHFIRKMLPVLGQRASDKNLYLSFIENQEQISIEADKGMLEKIVYNLIDNAIKYTRQGEIIVATGIEQQDENGFATLTIKDTGIGIPADKIRDIFHKFRQASEGYNREFEGAGLGLSVTRGMVELLDGKIGASSELGAGSEFKIMFPLAVKELSTHSEQTKRSQQSFVVQPGKMKILAIEDETAHQKYMQYILKNDFDIVFATTGAEAIAMAYNNRFDLIIMDINLGKSMNGIDAMIEIRELDGYKHTPIIAATANVMKGQKDKFLDKGFSHYLSKPYKAAELKLLVDEILK